MRPIRGSFCGAWRATLPRQGRNTPADGKDKNAPPRGRKKGAEMDGMTDREYVDGVEPYVVVAGECPAAPAGSIVNIFPHVGWSEAGEVVTYAGVDGRGGVTFGRVLDVLYRGGDAVYLIARQDLAEPPIEVPDSEVVGEVLSIIPPDEVAALIAAEFQTAGGRGGAAEAGPVRVSRPRRARRRR